MAKDNNKAGAEAPATLEEALKVIAKLEAEKAEAINDLTEALSSVGEIESKCYKVTEEAESAKKALQDVETNISKLEGENSKLKTALKEKDEVIGELSAQLKDMEGVVTEAKNAGLVNTTITIDKVTYVINHGSILDGTTYTKEELAENADVCKKILDKEGQQTLTKKEA